MKQKMTLKLKRMFVERQCLLLSRHVHRVRLHFALELKKNASLDKRLDLLSFFFLRNTNRCSKQHFIVLCITYVMFLGVRWHNM
jgi:hypothetical protein